jgi:hypothetical protein
MQIFKELQRLKELRSFVLEQATDINPDKAHQSVLTAES